MNNFLFEYSSKSKNASKRLKPFFKIFFILIFLLIIFYSFFKISFSLNIVEYEEFIKNLEKIFYFKNLDPSFPSNTVLENSLNYLWITIRVTLTGTTIGFILAILTSFLSSKNITNNFLSIIFQIFMLFLRSFPAIVFINATKNAFSLEYAAIIIFAWFSWIWCNKYLLEIIKNIDVEGYKWFIKKGHGKIYSFKKQILDRAKNKFIMIFLYSFESNFRWTTMLATVGVIGIGFFINNNIPHKFEFVGIPLTIIFITIFLLEIFNIFVNKILLNVKSKNKQTFNWKKFFKISLIFLVIFITIYSLWILNSQKMNFLIFKERIQSLFNPKISLWLEKYSRLNPWLGVLELFYQCIIAIFIAMIYSITMSIFLSEKLQKWFIFLPAKIINTFLKIIPIIIFFYILNPLFLNSIGLATILFGFHSGSVIAKQLSESINSLEKEKIDFYKLKGYSKIFIIKKYAWPIIKKDFKSFSYIRLEVIFRNMIILGSLGFSIIGNNLDSFEHRQQLQHFAAYIWVIVITIFIYNTLPFIINWIRRKIYEKNY